MLEATREELAVKKQRKRKRNSPGIETFLGKRFGRLVVIGGLPPADERGRTQFLCRCDCGGERAVLTKSLKNGNTRSCGCLQRVRAAEAKRTHNLHGTPEHIAWKHIHSRCKNQNDLGYDNYGGRGICVCDRWSGIDGFANFLADVGPRPSPKHSIDRIDVNGHYEPGNCRWATRMQQARNTRRTVYVTAFGQTKPLPVWAEEYGLNSRTFRSRLRRKGMSPEEALTRPLGRRF